VELAKLAEHRLKDRVEALRAVTEARELVRRGLVLPGVPGSETGIEGLERRWARLAPHSPAASPRKRGEGEAFDR
jgi:hypothetical protein